VTESDLRADARAIWDAAVAAANPHALIQSAVGALADKLSEARRILVVGGGKAGSAMAVAFEQAVGPCLDKVEGIVNVPAGSELTTKRIMLLAARPAGSNHPTAKGVAGADEMLQMVAAASKDDVVLCLLSGGGSALLPAPAQGISLADKQAVTRMLHECGATIDEMNAVRKHLSRIKGGRLAQACRAGSLVSWIISDVVGDPLDVIASGPTSPDPTTFADADDVLRRYGISERTPASVRQYLEAGVAGQHEETPKQLTASVENVIIGSNVISLQAAEKEAVRRGYRVLNLGSFVEGETREAATVLAGIVRGVKAHGLPAPAPLCVLVGGETTVRLGPNAGKGGRNQEFVLAMLQKLGPNGMDRVVALSGGTDGEDGPTDAAGAVGSSSTLRRATSLGSDPRSYLDRHDAYPFFDQLGDLIKTGLTNTNVMDVRVILIGS
jgi:hydroxypyruvate reductase/glycerate 2-kinase